MKKVTVTLDEDLFQRVEQKAQRLRTSVSAVLEGMIVTHASDLRYPLSPEEFNRLAQLEKEISSRITNFSAADRLPRDQLHDRKLTR